MRTSGRWALAFTWLCIAGCASTTSEVYPDYVSRAERASDGPITVSAAALTPTESIEVYGRPLALYGIQPVWIEVENRDSSPYWFLPQGLDPNYFPYWEAAELFPIARGGVADSAERERFRELGLPDRIPPASTTSGFVLTNLDEGFKFVHTDFLRSGRLRHTSMLVGVPNFRADYQQEHALVERKYHPDEVVNFVEEAALREALAALPCCVTNKKGSKPGDPLNLVIVGGSINAFAALAERGWSATETTWAGSVWRMMTSALSREPYLYSPVSPLYLYGRPQDVALQKARDNIHQRNHLRLWRAPMTFHGQSVWVGQISRDVGSRLTIHSPWLATHKIDPDVDEARGALAGDLIYTSRLSQIGLVKGVGAASRDSPRANLTTDPYYTDGLRLVLVFSEKSVPLDGITVLPWEKAVVTDEH